MKFEEIGLKPSKEQAKIIFDEMYRIIKGELQYPNKIVKYKAKQCAISSIKEILFNDYPLFLPDTKMEQYWKSVISELNAL